MGGTLSEKYPVFEPLSPFLGHFKDFMAVDY